LKKRVEILYGKEKTILENLNKILSNEKGEGKILINQTLLRAGRDYYERLFDIMEKIDIDNKTVEGCSDLLLENIKQNRDCIIKDTGIKSLKNIYKGKPIFVVAAGPSLDINMAELKNIGDKGIIIAVGTIGKILLQNEIIPDFIVITDGKDNIYKQVSDIIRNIPLLYIPGANYKAVTNYSGNRIVAIPDKDPFYEKLEKQVKKGYISIGGSVATAALDFAYQLGGNPIVFVGQDLALSKDLETHADKTMFKTQKKMTSDLREVDGLNDDKVYTLKNLYHYLRWIEQYIAEKNDIEYINASARGAKIKGTNVMQLDNVIKKFCTVEIDKSKIKLTLMGIEM